ncbi:MAG: hypothetical protein HOQ44_07480 [Nocardia sp.]|nr:hypothetical protein [Nocardia sp.]
MRCLVKLDACGLRGGIRQSPACGLDRGGGGSGGVSGGRGGGPGGRAWGCWFVGICGFGCYLRG